MTRNILFLSLFQFLFFLASQAQSLSQTEQKIVDLVSKNNAEAIALIEKTVNINSGTLNLEGVKNVGVVFKAGFDAIGMETKWIDMPPEMNRAGHLFATTNGQKGKKLLLIGHLDTVFEKDSPFQTFVKDGELATAPGGNDMKGGNIIILYALKALKEAGVLDDAKIVVALHGDEEAAGDPISISRKDILDAAKRSDYALAFETSTGFDYATVARRGSSNWTLTVTGKRAHSSGIFSDRTGAGAIYEASRILYRFYSELQEEYLTYNPGIIVGGSTAEIDKMETNGTASGKSNVVAETVVLKGDLRFLSEEQKQKTREKMLQIVQDHLPQTNAEITFEDGYPAMSPTEGNMALLQILSKVSQDLGQGEVKAYDPGKRGAGDISFVAPYVNGLDGLGAMGTGAHSNTETIDLSTFEALTKRTAILIYRLSQI